MQGSLDDFVVQALNGISSFLFTTGKIGSIFFPNFPDDTTNADKGPQGLDEGVRLQRSNIYNVDSSAGETNEDASVKFLSATTSLDVKGTKEVQPRIGEGSLMRCLTLGFGRSPISCFMTPSCRLRQRMQERCMCRVNALAFRIQNF